MDHLQSYANFLRKHIRVRASLRAAFDCSNGTAGLVMQKLGKRNTGKLEAVILNGRPDGNFPAHGPNPWAGGAIPALGRDVVKQKADCGAIFDADGDRVFFVDDKGRLVGPDHTAILMAQNFKGPVILDVRQGFLVREWLTAHKRKIVDSRVGHFFIKKLMRKKKIPFAAELSGHYYFKDFFYCDSGIFAAIQFLNAVSRLPGKLSEWIDAQPKYWQSGEINFAVKSKMEMMEKIWKKYERQAKRKSRLDGIKMEFGAGESAYWFSIRASNTEDLLRLNLEAKEKSMFDVQLRELTECIQ